MPPLELVREPKNMHDVDAAAVNSRDEKLAEVPRAENSAIAQMMDRGESLEASISQL